MQEINLYIATGARSPGKQRARYLYILELKTARGPVTLTASGYLEGTRNHIEAEALKKALERVNKPVSVHLYTGSGYLAAVFEQGWLSGWVEQGWKNRKGKPVSNQEEWRKVAELLCGKDISVHRESLAYSRWMERELAREERKEQNDV